MQLSPGVVPILLSTLFFGLMTVGVKLLDGVPVHQIVLVRSLVTLVVALVMLRRRRIAPWGTNHKLLIGRGLVGTAALLMYFWTLQSMPLASAVTIQHLSPLFTILIAAALVREPPRPLQIPLFLVALGGVVLVKGFDPGVTVAELGVGVGAALFAALAYNFIRMLRQTDDALVVVLYFPLVTVPIIGPYALLHWHPPSATQWGLLVGVGLATTVAQVFMTRAYQADRAANISIFNYLGIVLALLLGALLFGEVPRPLALLGVALIGGSVALSSRAGRVSPRAAAGTGGRRSD